MFRSFRSIGWAIFFFLFTSINAFGDPTLERAGLKPAPATKNVEKTPIPELSKPSSAIDKVEQTPTLPESGDGGIGLALTKDLFLLRSDEKGIIFRYIPPELSLQRMSVDQQVYYDLSLMGSTFSSPQEGHPKLPSRLIHLGIPIEGEVQLEVQNLQTSSRSLEFPISPYSFQDGLILMKEEVYNRERLYPGKWVEKEGIAFLRNQRVLSVLINPFQYNPRRKSLQSLDEIQIRVNFLRSPNVEQRMSNIKRDPFERVYKSVLLNYKEAKGWRRTQRIAPPPSVLSSKPWLKISTKEEGIYRITYNDLDRKGVPVDFIDPATFQLFNGGSDTLPQSLSTARPESVEVSLYIAGEEDGTFDPGDEIHFFGIPMTGWRMESDTFRFNRNPYTDVNIYWLTWEGGAGLRMDTLDGSLIDPSPNHPDSFQESLHFEEEVSNPQRSGLSWIWEWLHRDISQFSVSFSFSFALSDLASTNGKLRLILYGKTIDQHNVRVRLNGFAVADTSWNCPLCDLNKPIVLSPQVSQFREGNNTVVIEEYRKSPVESDVYFDYAEAKVERQFFANQEVLIYASPETLTGRTEFSLSGFSQSPLVLDVSDPFHPLRVVNVTWSASEVRFQDDLLNRKRYAVASRFKRPVRMLKDSPVDLKTGGADYIALCYDGFYDAVLPLVQWRENHLAGIPNPVVERVKVSDVYDNFSWGVVDPTAIRDYLKYAYENWSPQPSYCLFVGAGSYDYYNNFGLSPAKNFLPPYQQGGLIVTNSLFPQDLNPGYDDWFVTFDDTSAVPQLFLGRITVLSPQETRVVVNKIIDYEKNKAFGPWRNRVLLAADDEFTNPDIPIRGEALFTKQCENLHNSYIQSEADVLKVYMVEFPFTGKTKQGARDALIAGIDEGFLAGLYLGHGNIDQLAHEKLFLREPDVDVVKNGQKTFFMYFGSCSVGQFDRPEKQDMASLLQKRGDGGGIATFAASRSSYAGSNGTLAYTLFEHLFITPMETFGEVITATKISLGASHKIYNLFGDPASSWSPPDLDVSLSLAGGDPVKRKKSTSHLIGLSQVTINGTVSDPNFNGFASLTVFDSAIPSIHPVNPETLKYILPGVPIYRGMTQVTDGKFVQSFTVPDPSGMHTGNLGRISAYVWDGVQDGHGALDNLFVGGSVPRLDNLSPEITLYHGGRVLTPTDTLTVPLNPRITLVLEDESGIYLGDKRPDHQLLLFQDDEDRNNTPIYLNHLFQYDRGSQTRGVVQVDLQFKDPVKEEDMTHILEFRASDNVLNSQSFRKVVVKVIPSHKLALFRVMNYPNPIRNHRTQFVFELAEENVEVEIKVYTVTGRLIKILRVPGRVGLNTVAWDCRDEKGDAIANGVYLYKVRAKTMNPGITSASEKVQEVVEKLIVAH
jgi:hypothetical protein